MLATSDVPGGVANMLTGRTAELAPWLAAHAEVQALDLAGRAGGAGRRAGARRRRHGQAGAAAAGRRAGPDRARRASPGCAPGPRSRRSGTRSGGDAATVLGFRAVASDIVPIQLSLTAGDLVTLWAPRWREDGEEWEAFLGDDDALFAFPEVAQLAAFVRTAPRARPGRPPRLVGGARPDRRRADPGGDPPLRRRRGARARRRGRRHLDDRRARRDHRRWSARSPTSASWTRCTEVLDAAPGSRCCTRARCRSPGARAPGCGRSWCETIAERWDEVIDALDELVDDPRGRRRRRWRAAEKEVAVVDEEPPTSEPDADRRGRRRGRGATTGRAGFWEEVGIDPIRITTARRRLRHPALLSRRRAGLPRLRRADRRLPQRAGAGPARSPSDGAEGHDLAAASTWPEVVERAGVGRAGGGGRRPEHLHADRARRRPRRGHPGGRPGRSWSWPTELLLDVGDWAGDDEAARGARRVESRWAGWSRSSSGPTRPGWRRARRSTPRRARWRELVASAARAARGCDQSTGRSSGHAAPRSPGLITSLISASRSSKPMNADFIALTVNHCRSAQP